MEPQEHQTDRPRRKRKKNRRNGKQGERKKLPPFTQHFGPGMMVSHKTHGLGHVTSAYRRYVNVYFYMDGQHRNLNHRELKFTREEQIRRSKIRKAMDKGKAVTAACAPGVPVVHRLMGFGEIHGAVEGSTVLVRFDNEYTKQEGETVEIAELRQVPPPPAKTDDKKKKGRR